MKALVIGFALLLAGCASHQVYIVHGNQSAAAQLKPQAGKSAVVFGYALRNVKPSDHGLFNPDGFVGAGLIQVDPKTGRRIGDTLAAQMWGQCSTLPEVCNGTLYNIRMLPPGTYALAVVYEGPYGGSGLVCLVEGKCVVTIRMPYHEAEDINADPAARVVPTTYTFTVGPDETVYIANFIFDFENQELNLSTTQTPDDARHFLAKDGLADGMMARPMKQGL